MYKHRDENVRGRENLRGPGWMWGQH